MTQWLICLKNKQEDGVHVSTAHVNAQEETEDAQIKLAKQALGLDWQDRICHKEQGGRTRKEIPNIDFMPPYVYKCNHTQFTRVHMHTHMNMNVHMHTHHKHVHTKEEKTLLTLALHLMDILLDIEIVQFTVTYKFFLKKILSHI